MRAALLAILMLAPGAASAGDLVLAGRYGYSNEWELSATLLQRGGEDLVGWRTYAGPLYLKRLGGAGEVSQRTGSIGLRSNGVYFAASLTVGDELCLVSGGTLSKEGFSFADCGETRRMPLKLWVK